MNNNLNGLKEAMSRFGAAMFVPVLLFSFSGLLVGVTIMLKTPQIVGALADPNSLFYKVLVVMEEGGWTIFRNMPLFFCLGIPIGLSKIAPERAVLATLICYLSYNYFIGAILGFWGSSFGVDFSQDVGGVSGLAMIAGIKTLDTNIIGGILIGGIITSIHNRFYEFKLPDYLGTFQGTSFVHIIGFFVMIPVAFLTALIWPPIQGMIQNMQAFLASSGALGVWLYTFFERLFIPTGLHHFIYGPFLYGPAVVPEGISAHWLQNVVEFTSSGLPLKEVFPEGGFALFGNAKIFGSTGMALAMYSTAKPENKKQVAALVIPAALTAVLVGITEPIDFTFLFVAPVLYVVHCFIAATLATTLFVIGIVGDFNVGIIAFVTNNWVFTFQNHSHLVWMHIAVGLSFSAIYYFVFRFLILKFNFQTPGRGEDEEVKLMSKKEFKEQGAGGFTVQAQAYLDALGGASNIDSVTNCATRLRVVVKDPALVQELAVFKASGAHGLVLDNKNIHVIVGLSVPQVRTQFEELLKK